MRECSCEPEALTFVSDSHRKGNEMNVIKNGLRFAGVGILWTLVILSLPVVLGLVTVALIGSALWGMCLRLWFWLAHAARGRRVLFVYSNSPNWQSYIEQFILPQIREQSVILNWSDRRHWNRSSPVESMFFRHFAGSTDFNPIALVYCGRGRIQAVRFYRAFRDLKHGNDATLKVAESELGRLINVPIQPRRGDTM
jgi:hypothetical protein